MRIKFSPTLLISPITRKILKVSAYILGSLVALGVGFHFWFINHAERLLEDLVKSRSNGKLKLHVKKFKFNWFSYDMQLRNAVFYSTDTTATTSYQFGVERINVRVKEILPLVFEKKILIDSLSLINPDIRVTLLKSSRNADTTSHQEISLPHEMGKVYNSIRDALEILEVSRFRIENGKFTLINKMRNDQVPVTVSRLNLRLDNLQIDSSHTTARQKILFSDNVSLNTHHQDILFPDGRHRLSFSNFHINILEKSVSFDSCTISAIKSDSTRSSFSVFFDKLRLTNIDFDTLYQKEVIKADSVYCTNPRFKLYVELDKRNGKQGAPRLDELIQQLTGDLELAFVIVDNGSFDINTMREGRPSSFTSDHNNFEMRGLRFDKNSRRHVSVESFAMGIRNYENFLRDSAYLMQFDSILFVNNRVFLSNFSFQQLDNNNKVINSFSMPQFELMGLSWDDLIFEKNLSADWATLYRPVINYSVSKSQRRNIFQTLADVGNIIQLQNLDMSNGKVNIHFKEGMQLQLENVDMSLLSQDLVESKHMTALQRSIRHLKFKKGLLRSKNLTAKLENVDFYGENGKLSAQSVHLETTEKNLLINAKNVSINSMIPEKNSIISEINGLQWQEATVEVRGLAGKTKSTASQFTVNQLHGSNTHLSVSVDGHDLTAYLQTVAADKISLKEGVPPQIINLQTSGSDLSFKNKNEELGIARFAISDHQHSELENLQFTQNTSTDSIYVKIPAMSLEPDLNPIMQNNFIADNVKLAGPVIQIKQFGQRPTGGNKNNLPAASIGKLSIEQPEFLFVRPGDNTTRIEWHGQAEKNNSIAVSGLKIKKGPEQTVEAEEIGLAVNNLSITASNKTISTGTGSIRTKVKNFHAESSPTHEESWNGLLAELYVKDIVIDNIGRHAGRLEISSALLNDLNVQSASLLNFRQTFKENPAFRLSEATGRFDNANRHFEWHRLGYDRNSKIFSLDSFLFHPTVSKDSFIASHPYQSDYITLRTGNISAGPFEIDRYFEDTVINVGTVNVHDLSMHVFRDKRKPEKVNIVKPLPVNLVKRIPALLSIDTTYLVNSHIEYAELNEKTNQTGTVIVNKIQGKIFPVVNYDIKPGDSLHLEVGGRLMDSVSIAMNLRESYTDSLANFLLSANVRPANAKVINPILVPLVSAKLESGFLDTLTMRVKGNEYLAIGEMQMFYHDLRIKLLDRGLEKKTPFFKSFLNFLANSFIIKKNNQSRTGDIYFERIRSKSTMNYLVKIIFSGIGSNVGLKKSKKLLRRYKKEKQKRNLPILSYD